MSTVTKTDIFSARRDQIEYTDDQKKALLAIQDFLKSWNNFFLLAGNAGTGKTTIAENIAFYSNANVIAPTNAAVQRLKDKFLCKEINATRFATIHSTLYGSPNEKSGKFYMQKGFKPKGVYIVDECSMIDYRMLQDIVKEAIKKNAKIIFMGDDFQLEPVGKDPHLFKWEKSGNKEFKDIRRVKLNQVRRNDGAILKIATHIRSTPTPEILNLDSPDFQIVQKFSKQCVRDIKEDGSYAILVSTNQKRMYYNKLIRKMRFGDNPEPFMETERLMSVSNQIMMNGEQFTIRDVKLIDSFTTKVNIGSRDKPVMKEYDFYHIQHKVGESNMIYDTVLVPNLDAPSLYGPMLVTSNYIASNPRLVTFNDYLNRYMWKQEVNIATYGYAISVHKSQGNEWDNVYIDASWLSDAWNHSRWMYTAITRAKKKVELMRNKYIKLIDG